MKSLCHLSRAICRVRVVYYRVELPGSSGAVPPSPSKPGYMRRNTQGGQNKVRGQRSEAVAEQRRGGRGYLLRTGGVVLSTRRLLDLLTLSAQGEIVRCKWAHLIHY